MASVASVAPMPMNDFNEPHGLRDVSSTLVRMVADTLRIGTVKKRSGAAEKFDPCKPLRRLMRLLDDLEGTTIPLHSTDQAEKFQIIQEIRHGSECLAIETCCTAPETCSQGALCMVHNRRESSTTNIQASDRNVCDQRDILHRQECCPACHTICVATMQNLSAFVSPARFYACVVDPFFCVQKTLSSLCKGASTAEVDNLLMETCNYQQPIHYDFALLAGRVAATQLWKTAPPTFSQCIQILCGNEPAAMTSFESPDETSSSPRESASCQLITPELQTFVNANAAVLDQSIVKERDLTFTYFAFKTLQCSYLMLSHGRIVETPQYLMMRVACSIHLDVQLALETYEMMARKLFIHASPTLFNSGTRNGGLSSCFLVQIPSPSFDSIFSVVKQCALISAVSGGIGLTLHKIAARNSAANNTITVRGIIPVLRVFNEVVRCVNQAQGRRKGPIAIYIEPWHADIISFLHIRKNSGTADLRARDLFTALWVPDLFMQRVLDNLPWTLMDPVICKGLDNVWGQDFNELYTSYERRGMGCLTLPARKIWSEIVTSQIETGTPYILFKDGCNSRSNQQHLGTIQCSNLCAEIVQYTSPEEIAVCNLASISLSMFVKEPDSAEQDSTSDAMTHVLSRVDFKLLDTVVRVLVRNLDALIDRTYYPVLEAEKSNIRHRPLGIGVHGMAGLLAKLHVPYDCESAAILNLRIFERIYFTALDESANLAAKKGHYPSFPGSPASRGLLQFDLWRTWNATCIQQAEAQKDIRHQDGHSRRGSQGDGIDCPNTSKAVFEDYVNNALTLDWSSLRAKIVKVGLRNSLLTAVMPTASTAHILDSTESLEPFTSNLYRRSVLAGEFIITNPYLVRDLTERGLWCRDLKQKLVGNGGSVQGLPEIPPDIAALYKTAWEIKQKWMIDRAADRGLFVDQSQSLNLYLSQPSYRTISSMLFYSWRRQLKTGIYYLRTRPSSDPTKVTIPTEIDRLKPSKLEHTPSLESNLPSLESDDSRSPACSLSIHRGKKYRGGIFREVV
eukprot:GHVT01011998.1.p1 GENE.GHVT01011998.1~~GHVT01011998.1.p1  ORF type:complete len:1022 (+),score=44.62 GHVT01011998.1:111-3176(+)